MQTLQEELKNTLRDTSLVPSTTVSSGLKREEIPSDQNGVINPKLTCNHSEENHREHRPGSNPRVLNIVYVLNKRGQPLMPSCQSRARRLLKNNQAKVVKQLPFTIQLVIPTGEVKQEILVLGEDTGSQWVGISAVSDKHELFAAEVYLRDNIVKLISERRTYRRSKRSRHHRYREARFNNRKKEEGWIPPSIQHKVNSHKMIVDKVAKFLPITSVKGETAKFDIQRINNPEISGEEYQNGVQKDFLNAREYVLYRDNHTCQHCKSEKNGLKLIVHHIISRQTGGDRPDNLITLCEKCHKKLHEGKIKLNVKVKKNFRPETCMSIIRPRILSELRKDYLTDETLGYITKSIRKELGLEKSHVNDAFVIAGGTNQSRCGIYYIEQKRRNNRGFQMNIKGRAISIRKTRYKIQPSDFVKVRGKEYIVKGMFNKGSYVKVEDEKKKIFNFKIGLVESYFNRGTWLWN